MSGFIFWQRWLFAVAVFIVIVGLGISLFNATPLFDPINRQVDPVFWGQEAPSSEAIAFRSWAYSVLGATMAGWGIFIAFLAQIPFRHRERWAWNCIALGILIWYTFDTSASLLSGVAFNAVLNTVILVLAGLPLGFTFKDFRWKLDGST